MTPHEIGLKLGGFYMTTDIETVRRAIGKAIESENILADYNRQINPSEYLRTALAALDRVENALGKLRREIDMAVEVIEEQDGECMYVKTWGLP